MILFHFIVNYIPITVHTQSKVSLISRKFLPEFAIIMDKYLYFQGCPSLEESISYVHTYVHMLVTLLY